MLISLFSPEQSKQKKTCCLTFHSTGWLFKKQRESEYHTVLAFYEIYNFHMIGYCPTGKKNIYNSVVESAPLPPKNIQSHQPPQNCVILDHPPKQDEPKQPQTRVFLWLVNLPTPRFTRGFIAGLIKGNHWLISPGHKEGGLVDQS